MQQRGYLSVPPGPWPRWLTAARYAAVAAVLLAFSNPVAAEDFRPVVAEFGGHGSLSYPPSIALEINEMGTVEFWVAAKWSEDPGYDPAILSYAGPSGPRFSFHIAADRKAFGVFAGSYYNMVPFDFSDGALHHVAVESFGSSTQIFIDGALTGTLGYGFAKLPATAFTIGAIDGRSAFIGEIGQVRIWNSLVDEDVLTKFRLRPIIAGEPDPHPDIDSLVGMSSFADPDTGGFIFFGVDELVNTTLPVQALPPRPDLAPLPSPQSVPAN